MACSGFLFIGGYYAWRNGIPYELNFAGRRSPCPWTLCFLVLGLAEFDEKVGFRKRPRYLVLGEWSANDAVCRCGAMGI
jgi:hypothetical protein